MAKPARVIGVADKPEPDGDHVVQIELPSGDAIEAVISPEIAAVLVRLLQPQIVERVARAAQNVSLPRLDVTRFDLAHQGPRAQLMACIDQMGYVVLEASTETLLRLKSEVDRVLRMRSPSGERH